MRTNLALTKKRNAAWVRMTMKQQGSRVTERKEGEQQNKYNRLPETIFQKTRRTVNHEKQVSEKTELSKDCSTLKKQW